MKHRARIVAALVVALFLLAVPMASAQTVSTAQPAQRYGVCLSLNPNLTVCY